MASSVFGNDAEATSSPVSALRRAALMEELPTSKPRRNPSERFAIGCLYPTFGGL
jgi:hypothetical protein